MNSKNVLKRRITNGITDHHNNGFTSNKVIAYPLQAPIIIAIERSVNRNRRLVRIPILYVSFVNIVNIRPPLILYGFSAETRCIIGRLCTEIPFSSATLCISGDIGSASLGKQFDVMLILVKPICCSI